MKEYIEERAVEAARYIIEQKATVRQAAKKMGISKSTVSRIVRAYARVNAQAEGSE